MPNVTVIEHDEMAPVDSERLHNLESIIGAGMRSFVEVGNALAVIRDDRLYRATHRTFEAYVADRWGWTRNQAYNYVMAAEVADNAQSVVQLPTMSHALLLTAFSADQQRRMAPKIADLSVKDARKQVQQWRNAETNTDPVSKAAREEIREALQSEGPTVFFSEWREASAVMVRRMGELPSDELVSVAEWIKALAEAYNAVRESRRGS